MGDLIMRMVLFVLLKLVVLLFAVVGLVCVVGAVYWWQGNHDYEVSYEGDIYDCRDVGKVNLEAVTELFRLVPRTSWIDIYQYKGATIVQLRSQSADPGSYFMFNKLSVQTYQVRGELPEPTRPKQIIELAMAE